VYVREIDGALHTFGVSGKLIMNALVMYDHQTRTLWSQFLGQGVEGPLAGTRLEFVPVNHTQWRLWRDAHPDTLVLDKGGRYQSDVYAGYYGSGAAGVLGEASRDGRLPSKELVVGVAVGGQTRAFPLGALKSRPVVNDSLAGEELLVFLERETDTAIVYRRVVEGDPLTFELYREGSGALSALVDAETGTKWAAMTGTAFEGPLKGVTLDRVDSHLSFWFAWKDWHPETSVLGEP
jgi:hypothetical protein